MAQKVSTDTPADGDGAGTAAVTVLPSGVIVPESVVNPSAEAVAQVAAEPTPPPLPAAPVPEPKSVIALPARRSSKPVIMSDEEALEIYLDMVTYRRPHNSPGEEAFIKKYILPLNPARDDCGNHIVHIGKSQTMFSCHTDTVHGNDKRQKICFDREFDMIYKDDNEPLGADDATGIWIMLQMIHRKIPGSYLFHRGEERGGIGSGWIARNDPKWLSRFKRAVAFDRKNLASVITHQGGSRCCSDEFAVALALALNDNEEHGLEYGLDDGGMFTDTANYTEVISECTNLSAGYYDEHTAAEMQDTKHLFNLMRAACSIDWEGLPTVRKPEVKINARFRSYSSGPNPLEKTHYWDSKYGWQKRTDVQEGGDPVYNNPKSTGTVSGEAAKGVSGDSGVPRASPACNTSFQPSNGWPSGFGSSPANPQGQKVGAANEKAGEARDAPNAIEIEACIQWVCENQDLVAVFLHSLLEEETIFPDELEGLQKIQDELNATSRESPTGEQDWVGPDPWDANSIDYTAVDMVDNLDSRVKGMAVDLKPPSDGARPRRKPDPVVPPSSAPTLSRSVIKPIIAQPFTHYQPGEPVTNIH